MLSNAFAPSQQLDPRYVVRFMFLALLAVLAGLSVPFLVAPPAQPITVGSVQPAPRSLPTWQPSTVAMDIGASYVPKPAVATARLDTSVKTDAATNAGNPEPGSDKERPFFVVPPVCVSLDGIAAARKEVVTALKGVIFRSTDAAGDPINIKAFDSSRDPSLVAESDHDKLANVGMVLYPRGSAYFTMTLPSALTYSTISFDLIDLDHGKAKISVLDATGKVLWYTKVGATHTDASITTVSVPEQFVAGAKTIVINDRDSFGFLPHFGCGSIPQPTLPKTAGEIPEQDEAFWASLTPAELRVELMLDK